MIGVFSLFESVAAWPQTPPPTATDSQTSSFYRLLLASAPEKAIWPILDRVFADIAAGRSDSGKGVLDALVGGAGVLSDAERETMEFEVLSALLSMRNGGVPVGATGVTQSAVQTTAPWPAADPPPGVLRMYRGIGSIRDPSLRAMVLRAVSGAKNLEMKPLVLEGDRLSAALSRVPSSHEPGERREFGFDSPLEEEAAAFVYVCRGRVNAPLAMSLSGIAQFSRSAATVKAARFLGRSFFQQKH
jgi:hypothetical protein